jgi:hypothetical protein
VLAHGQPNERVWNFDYPTLTHMIRKAALALGLSFVPYQLRHSGASWDRLKGRRTLQEIQKRGMWRTHKSVTRYEQAARIVSEYLKINEHTRAHLELCHRNLESHVCDGLPVPDAPVFGEA